jgi:hypothetical protein
MIDFDKPMRVKSENNVIRGHISQPIGRFVRIGGELKYINEYGYIFDLKPMDKQLENIPEPKKRYQAQYSGGACGNWCGYRVNTHDDKPIAYLIETDHGECANPRYTYEREDV